jgi:amino acid adenylation domain-containing protein/non-ribosomal peptide synthase protein (TIGR01720 family)
MVSRTRSRKLTVFPSQAVIVEHRAYCSSAKAHAPRFLTDSDSRVLQFSAHTFDASLIESLTTLMVGGCVCVPSEEARLNNVVALINEMRVTHAYLTPSFIGFMEPSAVPGLKTLVLAGEAMSQAHVAAWSTKVHLINGYGPTESSVAAAINSQVTSRSDCKDIGFPSGVRCWIVDSHDHDKLLPVGCTGELLLEGPTLAQGYWNDPQKTAKSFIYDPAWAKYDAPGGTGRRFYKTGDLVRYNSDAGSLTYVGRKDTQVKLHGQRVELGEIEHHLSADPNTKHGVVFLPKSGYFEQKLVAVLSVSDILLDNPAILPTPLKLVDQPTHVRCCAEIRERMSDRVPAYMVPTAWLCVEALPFLTSGKLNRKSVMEWLEDMTEDDYLQITPEIGPSDVKALESATETESQLLSIWSRVLNLPSARISLEHSFLSLGGDSITAMTCMNQCKRNGIGLTVQEVLRSKSIKELAASAKVINHRRIDYQETIDESFDLSPIQNLHFQVRDEKQGHFNQSFFLRVYRTIDEHTLRQAIEVLILHHSMLRARFSQDGPDMKWRQRVTREIATSYRLRTHIVCTQDDVKARIAESQACLDALVGPVVSIDLFKVNGHEQLLSMIGHHLVIDLVSWRVILEDLEELLLRPHASTLREAPLPFQTWCRLQADHCQNSNVQEVRPVDDFPASNFAYWGMKDRPNLYGDVVCEGFQVDSAVTSLLLTECNQALGTEPVDVLLSALLHSFGKAFTDRPAPAIYNEGHGREAWEPSIDISRTVGWFTVICPIVVPLRNCNSVVEVLKRVKDYRRGVPDNGRAYFANRILASYDDENYRQMELVFNYLGQYQQLERSGALFQPVEGLAGENRQGGGAADYAQSTPRFGLVEISAVVVQKKIRFSFSFNRYMNHQASIHKWISECHQTLVLLSKSLRSMTRQPTLSDFPLLPLTYEDLQSMVSERLVAMGIKSMVEIEDAYPCSPLQQGLLLSLTRDRSFYGVHVTYEVKRKAFDRVNAERLAQAWQKVVDRHAALRTVFAEHLTAKEPYCQIVLRNFVAEPVQLQCLDDGEVLQTLERQPPMEYTGRQPAHRFSICKTATGKVFCRLELSHTIMDGMSISIIFRDMEMAYAGVLVENQKPLFSGFMSYLQKEPQEAGIEYWRNYLSNMEPCYFPVLNDGRSAEKQLRTLQLDFQRLPALQSWCDEHGITLAMAFHAAWSLTLRCYCGSDEVCFGYLISERDVPVDGIEEAVGPMINMLACRVNMPGNARLNQFLDQIQEDYMNSLPYKHTSLAQVQHALQLTETALFNTCLSYRKLPSSHTSREPDITFSEHAPIHDPTEYLVSLNVEVTGKAVMIELDYWTDSLSDEMAANLASTFLKALENITDHSTDEVGRLNHLNDHNIQQIVTWNSIMPATINRCVHDLFEEQVKMQPESPAIHAWDGSFSYAQVNKLSSQLAHYLARVGVIPENLVALCFDKSAWMIISMLAVLKAGGGCVPLDATLPKAALDTRVLDTGAQVVLASPKRAYLLEDVVPYVITVSESVLDQLPAAEGPACPTIQPSNTAFVLFTSGSTGKPKGVVIEHRAFATSADAHGSVLGVGPDTRFMQFAAYTFDNSLEEMFTTLLRGGCVCVPSDHDRLNNLVGAVNKLGANFMDLTPTVAAYIQPSDVPNVKAIAVGGEVLTKEITELWGKAVPLHNLYGPTECSVNCTHNPNGGTSGEVGNIGRSIGSVSWVVDPSDHDYLVPVGCAGELLIEGPILARGYLNNREKTEQSFIENPLWVSTLQQHATAGDDNAEHTGLKRPTQRVYKTGDLVRYASDGSLVYLGRKDTQVKLNGQRIELGEIEHHVKKALPSECQSAVELTKIHSGTKVTKALVALVSHKTDGSVPAASADNIILPMSEDFISTAAALQKSLLSFLPAYMVPNLYMPVVQMPLTSSGKLNRRILRITAEEILNQDATLYRLGVTGGRAPSTRTEKFLQELWASVLSIDASTISADDTFFRHGGDSMGAILLVAAARKQGCILTVASVFQTPKLSDMAKNVTFTSETTLRDEPNGFLEPFSLLSEYGVLDDLKNEIASLCQVQIDAVDDIYPCSPMQEGLIALSNKRPGAYVTQNIYRLPADIDIERFQNAWQAVAESEVVLSTRVVYTKVYGFLQAVIREPLIWQSVHDIEAISETDRHLPSCNGDILSRYTIAGEGTDSRCFVWTAHHALYDGWSIPMLLSRVESYYLNPRAPERAFDSYYPRFIEHLMGIDTERSDQFWRERLTGTTSSQVFPLPRASHEVSAISKLRHITKIDRPPGMEITVPSLVRAAWALTLSVYSYSDDVVFGEILTGRDAPLSGIASMIGPTIAAVPMRIQIERELSVQELLVDIQKQAAGVLPYQFAGLQHIKTLSPDATVACGFQTMLAITHAGEDVNQSIWNLLSSESAGSSFHTYPLTISTTISDTRLDIDAHYDPVLIPTSQVERFLSQFETFLARLCSNSNAREKISHMELLSFQEWTTLQRWNGESLEFVHRCIHEMIDDIVRLQPEEMAVCSWDGTFTYWGLHQQSTRLAHRLIELGVCPDRETFVPICFEKSAFTIVAMLAILKAGGSFVPLDPQHPKSRLQEIVADLNADLVLCSPRYLTLCKTIAGKTLGIDFRLLNELPVQSCPTPACASNSAAYAIFTSGTTGKPKGSIGTP